jgi:hypothetical protein
VLKFEKRSGKAGSESAKIRTGRGKMESWRAIDVHNGGSNYKEIAYFWIKSGVNLRIIGDFLTCQKFGFPIQHTVNLGHLRTE